jgi:hypothetical protein
MEQKSKIEYLKWITFLIVILYFKDIEKKRD